MWQTVQSPYRKPRKFSDPFGDWDAKLLNPIARVNLENINLGHCAMIFAENAPAADYQEGMYYLQKCFELMRQNDSPLVNYGCGGVFFWINLYSEFLEEDNLLSSVLENTLDLLMFYCGRFDVRIVPVEALREAGMRENLTELPVNQRSVRTVFSQLVKYPLYDDVVTKFLRWLDEPDPVKSCWWVELALDCLGWYTFYDATDRDNPHRQIIAVNHLLDIRLCSAHLHRRNSYLKELGYQQYLRNSRWP